MSEGQKTAQQAFTAVSTLLLQCESGVLPRNESLQRIFVKQTQLSASHLQVFNDGLWFLEGKACYP